MEIFTTSPRTEPMAKALSQAQIKLKCRRNPFFARNFNKVQHLFDKYSDERKQRRKQMTNERWEKKVPTIKHKARKFMMAKISHGSRE